MKKIRSFAIVIAMLSFVGMLVICKYEFSNEQDFVPPPFEENVEYGVPEVEEDLLYSAVIDGYSVSVCREICVEDNKALVCMTNHAINDVWMRIRLLTEDNVMLAESGIVKSGEFIRYIDTTNSISSDMVKIKLLFYEPETYYSKGTVTLETVIEVR